MDTAPNYYDYADEMAARETDGKRQITFERWCASLVMSRHALQAASQAEAEEK